MTFALSVAEFDFKGEALKRRLMECVDAQKNHFFETAERFYQKNRRSETDYRQLCESIIQAADQVLSADNWDDSLFLRSTLKPLKKIREQALELQKILGQSDNAMVPGKIDVNESSVQLYVSLYQANGHDLNQWAAQLASLSSYMVGRPIYQNESEAIQNIRSKISQLSESYVVVIVPKQKMIQDHQAKTRKDRLGNALISLLPDAMTQHKIIEFVHNEKHYHFNGKDLMLLT